MAKPNWLQRLSDTMLAAQTTSPTSVTGGDAFGPRAMAEFRKGDVKKAQEIQQKEDLNATQAMAIASSVVGIPTGAATVGLVPTLASEGAGWAGSVAAGYIGDKADQKLGTNWIGPVSGIVGGILSGIGAYRGLVKAGSRGLLKGSGNMYGNKFRSDVASNMMDNIDINNKISYNRWSVNTALKNYRDLTTTRNLEPMIDVEPKQHTTWRELTNTDHPGKEIKSYSEFISKYPHSEELETGYMYLDRSAPETDDILAELININGHQLIKTKNGDYYYYGNVPRRRPQTLTRADNNPLIVNGVLYPKKSYVYGTDDFLWWERNSPYFGSGDTFVIDNKVPSEYASKTLNNYNSDASVLTKEVDLKDPKLNFRFIRKVPGMDLHVESPFIFNLKRPVFKSKFMPDINSGLYFQQGGTLSSFQKELLNNIKSSNTNFVKRLNQPNRQTVPDWSKKNKISTHKLSYGNDNVSYFVYPEVQEINGKLIDFTRPPYHKFAGMNSAIENNDYVRTNSEDAAKWFTENYKNLNIFPKF